MLWRGGRRFKAQQLAPAPAGKKASQEDDVIMISDSEDEAPAPEPTEKGDQFEDEDEELDPSRPFSNILRSIDIPLGAKVLGLTVPNASPEAAPSRDTWPSVLSNTIVVAAVCADASTRIVSLPVAPPAEDANASFQTVTVEGGSVHILPANVAITFTSSDYQVKNQSQGQRRQSSPAKRSESWEILLAVQSNEAIGTLSIYRIPLIQKEHVFVFSQDPIVPSQKQFLPLPASGISFCPSQYPSDYHSWLLVSFPSGHVKVYSCLSVKSRKPAADRRPSIGGAGRSRELGGKWLLTLSTDFDPNSASGHRKAIVDTKWVLGGKAIIALLSDGEWGIWDIDNASHISANQANTTSRPQTSFAVSGRVLGSSQISRSGHFAKPSTSTELGPKFAPMTPSTRKVRENALFKSTPTTNDAAEQHTAGIVRGGIALKRANISWDQPWDDSALIWYGDKTVQIGSILSLWRNAVRPTSSVVAYDSSSRAKAVLIEGINLSGQNQLGVGYLPNYRSRSSPSGARKDEMTGLDVLVTAEYQLIILSLQSNARKEAGFDVDSLKTVDDHARLRKGELDLDGMDRMLASMSGAGAQSGGFKLFS